jgi:glycosyltransferase involved in cell wall biosynthesis
MRILLVNKFYFPQGGADKHVLQLEDALRRRGHEVAVFAMAHPKNQGSPWAKYFVSETDFSRIRLSWAGVRVIGRTFHSFEAARKMAQLLKDFRPDVVHIHNIYHQISPSILPVIRRHTIPIVMTLHDYALVSANYNLYAHGGICQHGKYGRYWEYLTHRCIKNSRAASFISMLDQWWHDRRRVYEKHISTFISPSRFLRDLVLDWKRQDLKIDVLPNFITTSPHQTWPKKKYVLYVGRLSGEKGVEILVRAAAESPIPIKIVGAGPDEMKLKKLSTAVGARNIEWLGWQSGQALETLIAEAAALVVPSRWYENCPLVILEAFAKGTPVLASRIGGIPELVIDGENGWLVQPDNVSALVAGLQEIEKNSERLAQLSVGAARSAQQYQLPSYLERLEQVYAQARVR